MRLRILIGTAVLVLGLAIYGVIVAAVTARLLSPGSLAAFAVYAVAGLVWVLPAARLARWMQAAAPFRPPPEG
jgi:hypothetical protein